MNTQSHAPVTSIAQRQAFLQALASMGAQSWSPRPSGNIYLAIKRNGRRPRVVIQYRYFTSLWTVGVVRFLLLLFSVF